MNGSVSVFEAANSETLDLIRTLNASESPVFLQLQISPLAAKAAFLLSMCVAGDDRSRRHVTFFGNSRQEALDGAIKVARHTARRKNPASSGEILILDADDALKLRHNPLQSAPGDELVPGLTYVPAGEFSSAFSGQRPVAVICRLRLHQDIVAEIFRLSAREGVLTLLDASDCEPAEIESLCPPLKPDVVVTGESLTRRQVPFGAFTMAPHVYRTWNSFDNCTLHTSTFGGNSLALNAVMNNLLAGMKARRDLPDLLRTLNAIDSGQKEAFRFFSRHVNPKVALLMMSAGIDRKVLTAKGEVLTVESPDGPVRVIDALGSYGACMRGHNPGDLSEVLDRHDPTADYWRELSEELRAHTGLGHVLPAVSGATAVEAALATALAAQSPRRKVVVFDKGFSGKTLAALTGTARKHYREAFTPLYPHVERVDPFTDDGLKRIRELCRSDEVALFWFETIQGEAGVRPIPDAALETLKEGREEGGYLVGIDEIQTGMFRTGSLLHSAGCIRADIVTLSKGLADMTFPIGAALLTDDVYREAKASFPEALAHYETYYSNQLGAHVALHGLRRAVEEKLGDRALAAGEILKSGLEGLKALSPMISSTRGTGLIQAVEFDSRLFGVRIPIVDDYFGAIVGGACLRNKARPLLTAYTLNNPLVVRFEPSLSISEENIEIIVANIKETVKGGCLKLLLASLSHGTKRLLFPGKWLA
jgi:acetylornithine/succinyldiaminopimelate/putrescine aminotransferase